MTIMCASNNVLYAHNTKWPYDTQRSSTQVFHLFPSDELDVYNVSNVPTIGFNEVSLTQLVVDGVKLLIVMEKSLENGQSIDELVPMQK